MLDNKLIIYINLRFYAELDLNPYLDEKTDTYLNNCILVDSVEKKSIDTIVFKSDVIIPMMQNKDKEALKLVGEGIRAMGLKHNIYAVKAELMPKPPVKKGKLYEKKI